MASRATDLWKVRQGMKSHDFGSSSETRGHPKGYFQTLSAPPSLEFYLRQCESLGVVHDINYVCQISRAYDDESPNNVARVNGTLAGRGNKTLCIVLILLQNKPSGPLAMGEEG